MTGKINPQFLLCENPNLPDQGKFIYHAKHPRFLAQITEDDQLEMVDNIDLMSESRLSPIMNRAKKWYISTLSAHKR